MKILLLSSEVAPFAKTGGLADVAAALPKVLAGRGHDVRVALPCYGGVGRATRGRRVVVARLDVVFRGGPNLPPVRLQGRILEDVLPRSSVPVYLIDEPALFDRPGLYGHDGEDYPDNAIRFAFFCYAALLMLKRIGWAPDVLHCNDWQTGLVPTFLRHHTAFRNDPFYAGARVLFTIHNLGYQGLFQPGLLAWVGLPAALGHVEGMEFWSKVSLLKAGIAYSDRISTVSEQYAREIQTPELGCGLDGFLRKHGNRLTGILNGVDYTAWNPATDPLIESNYSLADLSGKAACKAALQEKVGLPVRADVPLLGMVSRLDGQKGLDLLRSSLRDLMGTDAQLVVLGTGHQVYHEFLRAAQQSYPDRVRAVLRFDNSLAHAIEAGADAFLMPSLYEPCGLNQMYSLKYGTVPIVRRTGGLADTVAPADARSIRNGTATGFAFTAFDPARFARAVHEAVRTYREQPDVWRRIQHAGMAQDFSWNRSAEKYENLFRGMLSQPPAIPDERSEAPCDVPGP